MACIRGYDVAADDARETAPAQFHHVSRQLDRGAWTTQLRKQVGSLTPIRYLQMLYTPPSENIRAGQPPASWMHLQPCHIALSCSPISGDWTGRKWEETGRKLEETGRKLGGNWECLDRPRKPASELILYYILWLLNNLKSRTRTW